MTAVRVVGWLDEEGLVAQTRKHVCSFLTALLPFLVQVHPLLLLIMVMMMVMSRRMMMVTRMIPMMKIKKMVF